jgi:TrpR-related protein YerC/YecD
MKLKNDRALKHPDNLFDALACIETKSEAQKFLGDLCTPAEIEAFADRWLVAQMLDANIPYRKITEETGVSTATVTRVARFLNQGYGGYKLILKRIKDIKTT